MALHISTVQEDQLPTVEVMGVPVRRPSTAPAMGALQAEVERLRELIALKDNHITTLETQVWAWRSQAHAEATARRSDRDIAYERERDLVRILHRQVVLIQDLEERESSRRRWWQGIRDTL
jgi:hypothetical protein